MWLEADILQSDNSVSAFFVNVGNLRLSQAVL